MPEATDNPGRRLSALERVGECFSAAADEPFFHTDLSAAQSANSNRLHPLRRRTTLDESGQTLGQQSPLPTGYLLLTGCQVCHRDFLKRNFAEASAP